MEYFPFFMDIEGARCLIVGGGRTALHKLKALLPFKPEICVISPEICGEIREIPNIEIVERGFLESDLDGAFFAVSATDDSELNRSVYELCAVRKIPINVVDDPQNCTFIFPAIYKERSVTAAVSTNGKSPVAAGFIKKLIEDTIDNETLDAVDLLGKYREKIKAALPNSSARKQAFEALLDLCLIVDNTEDLCEEDVDNIIEAVRNNGKNEN